jgi:hypothetical protein
VVDEFAAVAGHHRSAAGDCRAHHRRTAHASKETETAKATETAAADATVATVHRPIARGIPMTLSRLIFTAAISGIAVMPAAAADLGGYYVKHRVVAEPYYVVNQGPVLSGPGISVTYIGLSRTGVRRAYPYVRQTRSYPYVSDYGPSVLRARY